MNSTPRQPADSEDPGPPEIHEKLLVHAFSPENMGMLANADGQGKAVGSCGDSMEVGLRIENDRIVQIRQMPHGCLFTAACASVMSHLALGRRLQQAAEMKPEQIMEELGGLPEDHHHCARLAVNALGEAISDHYQRRRNEEG